MYRWNDREKVEREKKKELALVWCFLIWISAYLLLTLEIQ